MGKVLSMAGQAVMAAVVVTGVTTMLRSAITGAILDAYEAIGKKELEQATPESTQPGMSLN